MNKLLTNDEVRALNITARPELAADATAVLWGNTAGIQMAARRRLTAATRG